MPNLTGPSGAYALIGMGSVFAGAARAQAAQRLTSARHGQLPVSDSNGGYVGIVTARTVAETVVHGGHDDATVASVMSHAGDRRTVPGRVSGCPGVDLGKRRSGDGHPRRECHRLAHRPARPRGSA